MENGLGDMVAFFALIAGWGILAFGLSKERNGGTLKIRDRLAKSIGLFLFCGAIAFMIYAQFIR